MEVSAHFMNAYMYGELEMKSQNWRDAVRFLWGGDASWETKFYVLTNVGMLVYEDKQYTRPTMLIPSMDMYV